MRASEKLIIERIEDLNNKIVEWDETEVELSIDQEFLSNNIYNAKNEIKNLQEDLKKLQPFGMELIKRIVIKDPPHKWVKVAKRKIDPDTGKLKLDTFYLTANIFYNSKVHISVQSQVIKFAKDFLLLHCQGLPKLEKMQLKVLYKRPDTNFDLDNKTFFWGKIFMDLIKTPTSNQILWAHQNNRSIKSLEILPEDSVKFFDKWHNEYEKGRHELIFEIYGRKSNEQRKLF